MPTARYDQQTETFILSEPGQVVTFTPRDRVIGVHSAKRIFDAPQPCEYLHGDGSCDASWSHGDTLRTRWEESGFHNQVIWDELQGWFDSYFPAGEKAEA